MSSSSPVHIPRTLTIGGSYSDGTAGIQADLKTFTALSTFGMSVVTALAPQQTCDVEAIHTVPETFVASQFRAVTSDIAVDALKIGMLFSPSLIKCVVSIISETQVPIVVLDPVMVATKLSPDSLTLLRDQLLPVATLITPTLNEAAILLDRNIVSLDDMKRAAQDLHRLGPKYVLVKGSYSALLASLQTQPVGGGNTIVVDVLFDGLNFTLFKSSRVSTKNAHDTGCTLSAAITAFLAHGIDMTRAVQHAIAYTHSAVQNSLTLDLNNSVLKYYLHLPADRLLGEPLDRKEKHESLIVDKQQQSQPESDDKVVIVSNQCWIHEPSILPQQRSFVQLLKSACSTEWFNYTHHPFVQGLANGTLPHASFKHYLTQDYIFLTHFARCNAVAAYKSNNMVDILRAAEIVCHIGRETKLHVSYCAEWGIDTESLESIDEARANLAYTRFTLDRGMTGDLLDLHVALSPCLLGYGEIGLRLFKDPTTKRDSPYWKWISNYAADDYQQACRKGEMLLEHLADEYGVWYAAARIKKLTNTFKTATKLEIGFWDMGLNVEW